MPEPELYIAYEPISGAIELVEPKPRGHKKSKLRPLELAVSYDPSTGDVVGFVAPPVGKNIYRLENGRSTAAAYEGRSIQSYLIKDKHVLPLVALVFAKPLWRTANFVVGKTTSGELWGAVHNQLEKYGSRAAKGVDKVFTNPVGACVDVSSFTLRLVGRTLKFSFNILTARPAAKQTTPPSAPPATGAAPQPVSKSAATSAAAAAPNSMPPGLQGISQEKLAQLQAMGFFRPGAPGAAPAGDKAGQSDGGKAPAGGISGLPARGAAKATPAGASPPNTASDAIMRAMMAAMPGMDMGGDDEDEDEDGMFEDYDEDEDEDQ